MSHPLIHRFINARVLFVSLLLFFLLLSLARINSNSSSFSHDDKLNLHFSNRLTTTSSHVPYLSNGERARASKPKQANATLDFQEILYISMPYRTDRQDALALLAASTGVQVRMVEGVDTSTMHPKAKPLLGHVDKEKHNETFLGVWRAHANAWRHIIDNDVSTALILEDDVDWDVNIRDIMGLWNWQLTYNNSLYTPRNAVEDDRWTTRDCAYGCDWDELFMGQCGNTPDMEDLSHFAYHDPHSPAVSSHTDPIVNEMTEIWNFTADTAGVRVVSRAHGPLCLMGYAVSRLGAMRMLYQIGGWKGFGMGVDNEVAFRTQEGKLSGYTLTPPVFTAWRTGGGRDSDNDAVMNEKELSREGTGGGWSVGLMKSARMAMADLLDVDRRMSWKRNGGPMKDVR